MEVRIAGGLQLRADGVELAPPPSKRARAVLAYLAVNPGPQQRGRLAARFWPDVLDESARASLRVALTELRQALGPAAGYVVATRDTVALDGPDLRVDTRAFRQALDGGDPVRALEACSGPILDGFDEDWALEARDEHAHRLGEALEQAAASAPDPAQALRLTRAQVALDPLAEAPNRRLIERLAATGDRAAALSAGRQFAERLRTQLGIPPSRDTRALLDELRRVEPASLPPPPSLRRAYDTEFVGRRGRARAAACVMGRRADASRPADRARRGRAGNRQDAPRPPLRVRRPRRGRHRPRGPLLGGATRAVRAVCRGAGRCRRRRCPQPRRRRRHRCATSPVRCG